MFLICNVGSTGTGKSHFVNTQFIDKGEKVFIYDIQNEYKEMPFFDGKKIFPQMRYFGSLARFKELLKKVPKGYTIIIEEATGIFKGSAGIEFIEKVLSKRHHSQNFVLNFHALHRIPLDLVDFTDIIVIRKTLDRDYNIEKKFPELLEIWKSIKESPNRYALKVCYMSNLTMGK